jgi:hypothetical protein
VEFYHLPVILIGLLLFRSKEWLARGVTLALPLAGLALVHFAGLAPSGVEGVEKVQLVHGLGALGLSIYVAYEAWMARGARSHQTPV